MAGRGAILTAACLALAGLLVALRLPTDFVRIQGPDRAAQPVVALRLPAEPAALKASLEHPTDRPSGWHSEKPTQRPEVRADTPRAKTQVIEQ